VTLVRAATHNLNTHDWNWFSMSWIVSVLNGAAVRSQWPVDRYMGLMTGLVPFDSHNVEQLLEVEYAAEMLTYRFSELDLRNAAIRLYEHPQYYTFAVLELLDTICRLRWLHCHPTSGAIETLLVIRGDPAGWFAFIQDKDQAEDDWMEFPGGRYFPYHRRLQTICGKGSDAAPVP